MFLILPNQLFASIDKSKEYLLYEHPKFFTKYNYHAKKLVLHRASMRAFYNGCKQRGIKIRYVEYDESIDLKSIKEMYNPCDKDIESELKHVKFLDSPMWLLSNIQLDEYKGTLFFHSFKQFCVKDLKLSGMEKSLDSMNRNRYGEDTYPNIPKPGKSETTYITEAIDYINSKKLKCYGSYEGFEYPITRRSALNSMKDFFDKRLGSFGKYQDSIVEDKKGNILYHSFLSSSINIGLLEIDEVLKYAYIYKSRVDSNAFEGYVRQLLWREYMRYVYYKYYESLIKSNNLLLNKKLEGSWYSNSLNTGILPVDRCVKKVYDTAYLHHIERLMIILNIFVLMEIKPSEMYKWFMTCFIDAYDWVMLGNVYIFSYSHKGSRKPYISSSNYIMKMSDYRRGAWNERWDKMYKDFIVKKREKLKGTIYYVQ